MKKSFLKFIIFFVFCNFIQVSSGGVSSSLVLETRRIYLAEYPDAFNPSIIKTDFGYLLTFRYCPNRKKDSNSYIGVVRLNESFDQISTPQLLDTRFGDLSIPSHSEDARIFSIDEKIYIAYNDNPDEIAPTSKNRRDIFVAELHENDDYYYLASPQKLVYPARYDEQMWQKNWVPFDWCGKMFMGYSISPHEVIYPDLETGICSPFGMSKIKFIWNYGVLRGGTPALLIGNEYLSFFHSSKKIASDASNGKIMLHYFMGAYTFSATPPFNITKITSEPIIGDDFYTDSIFPKRVVFPGGFVVSDDLIYVVYGKNEYEIWIATLDKNMLMSNVKSVGSSTGYNNFPIWEEECHD